MKKIMDQQHLTGERALFNSKDLVISNTVFDNGESPLKESQNIQLIDSIFGWKYPLWYCDHISAENITLLETARSGIWYTKDVIMKNSVIQAPKSFRRGHGIRLEHVHIPNAEETFWNCKDIELIDVQAEGTYFGMNSENIYLEDFSLSGNYAFDGAKNIEVHNSKLISKDAFWNCENVTVYDSVIIGEYLGWNSSNVKFVNCLIESEQGLCYVQNLVIENGKLINTDLAFEYSTVDVVSTTAIDSVKNPLSGKIVASDIKDLLMDDSQINPQKTTICLTKKCSVS